MYDSGNNVNISRISLSTGKYLISVRFKANEPALTFAEFYVNGVLQVSQSHSGSGTDGFKSDEMSFLSRLMVIPSPLLGKAQEFIIMGGDQTANRAAIEANINAYYNIY